MPARLAPDQSRGYLIAIGTTVRSAGETGIFKRLMGLLGDQANVVMIAATPPDDPTVDDIDSRLIGNGAHHIRRIALNKRADCDQPSVIAAISEARSHGDLSENAEYHAAKERQGWIEGRIAEIEDKISRAQVIDVTKLSGTNVKFGATITVVDEDTEEEARYQIVGEHEADVKRGKVSVTSPVARAIIGKESGYVVEVNTPGGVKAYEITKVEWI